MRRGETKVLPIKRAKHGAKRQFDAEEFFASSPAANFVNGAKKNTRDVKRGLHVFFVFNEENG